MINKNIVIACLGGLLTLSGCDGFMDTKIDTFPTDETIMTNRSTLFSYATAFYTPLRSGFNALDNNLFAAATDEAQQTSIGGNALIFNLGIMNSKSIPQSLYYTFYEGIRAANNFISFATENKWLLTHNRDTIADAINYKTDKLNYDWYMAEAHIAKAYYYAELIKRYGGVPIVENTYDNADKENLYIKRSSYDKVVDYIVSEIDQHKGKLQVNWKTSSYVTSEGRFSLGAALAIKTRVLLYAASPLNNPTDDREKWKLAAAAAQELMSAPGLNYALEKNYGSYFIDLAVSTSNETIFAIRAGASNTMEKANYPVATPGGNSGVCPTNNLVSAYEYVGPAKEDPYANRDPRLAASIVTNGSKWNNRTIDQSPGGKDDQSVANASRTGYYLKKFLTDNVNLVQNATVQHHWPMYRYGGFLLEYAEAMNGAYGPDVIPEGYTLSAKEALKKVRNRASTSLPAITTTNRDEFFAIVKHERQVELAFEDHRYWDLLRWKEAETVLNQPVQGVKVTKKSEGGYSYKVVDVAQRTFHPANYYYPFAYSDVVLSNNTLEQNPGY